MAIPPISSSSSASSQPQPLSFPAPVFAKLSPGPYLQAHLQLPSPIRPNHRTPSETRHPTLNTGSLSHASGSAVVRVGDTAVVCGVRREILLASDVGNYRVTQGDRGGGGGGGGGTEDRGNGDGRTGDRQELSELGLLVPNLELATGCSPAHLPGNPPSTLAQSLSHRILTLLHIVDLIPLQDLRIWYTPDGPAMPGGREGGEEAEAVVPEVKAFWTLYIDILFISLDGNPFDAAWGAVLAALGDTKLPRAWWDGDKQMVLCDERVSEAKTLQMNGFPVAATFAVFVGKGERGGEKGKGKGKGETKWILADPDDFEEGLCEEGVTVAVDGEDEVQGRVLRLEKSGGAVVGVREMRELVRLAGRRWREWRDVLGG